MFASKVKTIMTTGRWSMYDQTILGNPKQGTKQTWQYTTNFLRNCGIDFDFNFMGLMDTVPAYGIMQHNDMADLQKFGMGYNVDDTFKSVVHAVAMNENRYQLSRRSIYDNATEAEQHNGKTINGKYRLEKGFMGAHSDIGGGYKEGDISNASLMWIVKHAKEAGINIDDSQIEAKKYNRIDNPIIHDSVNVVPLAYTPGSEFRWAGETTRDWSKNSIFNTRNHLELSWDYIRDNFQNPEFDQLSKIKKVTKEYMDISESFEQGKYPSMLSHPTLYKKLLKYNKIKKRANDEPSILITTRGNQIIRINDYLTWLQCHYDIELDSSITSDVVAPAEKDFCTGTQLEY